MILDTLTNAGRYAHLHPLFEQAFTFMQTQNLNALAPGRHKIVGDDLFVVIQHVQARPRHEAQLECHRRYIDIQLVLEGVDEMGWKPLGDCHAPVSDYLEEKDICFFHDPADAWVATPAGAFCVFFPEDAHAPLVGTGAIRKAVFKVAVHPKA